MYDCPPAPTPLAPPTPTPTHSPLLTYRSFPMITQPPPTFQPVLQSPGVDETGERVSLSWDRECGSQNAHVPPPLERDRHGSYPAAQLQMKADAALQATRLHCVLSAAALSIEASWI